jgi:hypothetical protein
MSLLISFLSRITYRYFYASFVIYEMTNVSLWSDILIMVSTGGFLKCKNISSGQDTAITA